MTTPACTGLRHPPPHLSMDDYAAWIQASLEQVDPIKAARQKAMQEQIAVPFRIRTKETSPAVLPLAP